MKYQFTDYRLPKDKREQYNKEFISKLTTGQPVDEQEAFNFYTGRGGLHGLKATDFENFHAYTEAKKEYEIGQFFTPPDLCDQIIQSLRPSAGQKICDLSCGSGNFFNYLPTESNAYGCEIEPNAYNVARFLYPDANIVEGDFVHVVFDTKFDMIVGNPPFNLKFDDGISQFVYMQKCATFLRPGRLLCFLAPKTFLEDEYQNSRRRAEINKEFSFVCQSVIPKDWFDVDIDIKLMYFQKRANFGANEYKNVYVDFEPVNIYDRFIAPINEWLRQNMARIILTERQKSYGKPEIYPNGTVLSGEQVEIIKKCFYEFKTHAHLRQHLDTAEAKLTQLKKQEKPADMNHKDWEKARAKPDELINWLRKKVRQQNKPAPKKILKLVKTRHSIKYKAYSKALHDQERDLSIQEFILRDKPYTGKKFRRLLERKRADYKIQNTPWQKMERDPKLDQFLRDFELRDCSTGGLAGEVIKLNEKQFLDLGLAFQKRYSLLAWQQGSGKSVAGMAWIELVHSKVKNIFLTAPSLAVQLTWKVRLKKFGYNFIVVNKNKDFRKIRPGQIVVLSFDMIRILKKALHEFIKKKAAYNIALLVDESDELTNIGSGRTAAMLACFRRAKYKLLTTGTTTRNNINELYPQLELLYNNSINMLCWSEYQYRPDEKDVIRRVINDWHKRPFPARRGHNVFKFCHCPQKTTVFGIKQDTQDIYNAGALKDLIDKTILTRTFDDIVGKRIYQIKTHHVVQGKEEHRLYAKIIDDFYSIVYNYFNSTGNARREQLLRIIRQITLLIQSTSIPHTFKDYEGLEKPMKFYKILELLRGWRKEKVAIGTVMVESADEYKKFIEFNLPERDVFYITGSCSFSQRKKIIADFQATTNGILISTQQSLKSSVDIETCNKCILESLQWNIPKMSQYYFRFIRYNSLEEKEIHFVTYADTIEQNILALLMSKEKLNQFVKTTEVHSRADIMNDYNIDTGILDQIITKEYDSEGKLYLRWGKQRISKN